MNPLKPSTIVKSIHWDPDSRDMTVTLHGGKVYTYPAVAKAGYEAFLNAPSHGKHFASVVSKMEHKR